MLRFGFDFCLRLIRVRVQFGDLGPKIVVQVKGLGAEVMVASVAGDGSRLCLCRC